MPLPENEFTKLILSPAFPCVGAKSAFSRDQIEFCRAEDFTNNKSDPAILKSLQQFAQICTEESLFTSFVVLFEQAPTLTEMEFEHYLWQRLQSLHELDAKQFNWDASVSCDPASPHFSMSIGGKAFYVIGLHPSASRPARRFLCPALVFNLHSQFDLLREEGRYQKLSQAIMERDLTANGSTNKMLAQHGISSEASQYSGRQVNGDWKCPFHAINKGNPHDSTN